MGRGWGSVLWSPLCAHVVSHTQPGAIDPEPMSLFFLQWREISQCALCHQVIFPHWISGLLLALNLQPLNLHLRTAGATGMAVPAHGTLPCSPFCLSPYSLVCCPHSLSAEMPWPRGEDHGHQKPQFRNPSRKKEFLFATSENQTS